MKKTILFTLFALLGMTQAVAQEYEYVPFVREGVKWVYYQVYSDDPISPKVFRYNLEFKGEAEINGKTYKAMHKYYGDAINEDNDTIPIYMREEDKVVYGIIPDGKTYPGCPIGNYATTDDAMIVDADAIYGGREFVLYDFNDPVSYWDSIVSHLQSYYQYFYTIDVDTIPIAQHLAKRYIGNVISEFHMIEGIGMDGYYCYTLSFFMPMLIGSGGSKTNLNHVVENGQIIYKGLYCRTDLLTGVDEVRTDQPKRHNVDDNYYNLMGQAVGKSLPNSPGIYIHHGNKICVSRMR